MQVQKIKDYLLPLQIPNDDKRYVLNFCKKLEYLESLRAKVAKDTGMNVVSGYGDFNSKICFIFNNVKNFNIAKSLIQEKLDMFEVNFWQMYVTFVNKVEKDYSLKYDMLCSELSAIRPDLLYVFDNDIEVYNKILSSISRFKIPEPEHHFFIDVVQLASNDADIQNKMFYDLHYLINYKSLDIK